ncbi:MAG TPA: hypothetical protein VKW04_18470 [Planctomycetota bacterium]|nr:hypothetical protein [Planctomycetota bacterium]
MNSPNEVAGTSQQYEIQAIEGHETRVRKPRHWLLFTLRRLDDGRIIQAKLRLTKHVGDTVWLDDNALQTGLWKP